MAAQTAKSGMRCVLCHQHTLVSDTRLNKDGTLRRRRRCQKCGYRFTTQEAPVGKGYLPGPRAGSKKKPPE
jgi:hypothetical protein